MQAVGVSPTHSYSEGMLWLDHSEQEVEMHSSDSLEGSLYLYLYK